MLQHGWTSTVCQVKDARHKRLRTAWLPWLKISTRGKSIEMKSRLVIDRSWEEKGMKSDYLLGMGFPGSSVINSPPAMQEPQEMRVRSLAREDSLEEGTATHSSILAWGMPWTEEPGKLQASVSQRVRHDCRDSTCAYWVQGLAKSRTRLSDWTELNWCLQNLVNVLKTTELCTLKW